MAKSFPIFWRSVLGSSLAFGAALVSGCSVYDAALLKNADPDGGQVAHCVAGSAGCIPSAPAASTSDPSDAIDLTYALRDVRLTQTDTGAAMNQPWRFIGFNLDGIDTANASAPNGCATAPGDDGGVSEFYPLDGVSGIDNQFGAQLAGTLLPAIAPNMQNTLCCYQNLGRGTLLLRIRGWNGNPDDASVTMSITSALDGTSVDPVATPLNFDATAGKSQYVVAAGGAVAPPPSWVPDTDTWYTNVADVTISDVDRPRHVDVNAYVSSGYFVMHLDVTQSVKLFLGAQNGIAIGLRQGTMIAHLTPNEHLLDEGWIGGRMGSTELIDATYRLRANELYSSANGGNNASVCTSATDVLTPLIDILGDVLADGTNNPNVRCDALSAGVSFRGVRAKSVRIGAASLAIPYPDCDGATAVIGTTIPEETMMMCEPISMGSPAAPCAIRQWSAND